MFGLECPKCRSCVIVAPRPKGGKPTEQDEERGFYVQECPKCDEEVGWPL